MIAFTIKWATISLVAGAAYTTILVHGTLYLIGE